MFKSIVEYSSYDLLSKSDQKIIIFWNHNNTLQVISSSRAQITNIYDHRPPLTAAERLIKP